jgi:hypothetical protein
MILMGVFVILQVVTFGAIIGATNGVVSATEMETLISDLQDNGFVSSVCTVVTTLGCGVMLLGMIKLKKGAVVKEYLGLRTVAIKDVTPWMAAVHRIRGCA